MFELWLALAVAYAGGWFGSIPGALRRRMSRRCCPCGAPLLMSCERSGYGGHLHKLDWLPRGQVRDRGGWDVLAAMGAALWWPVRLAVVSAAWLTDLADDCLIRLSLRVAPLTGPERERRARDRAAEIARLTRQIEEGDHR